MCHDKVEITGILKRAKDKFSLIRAPCVFDMIYPPADNINSIIANVAAPIALILRQKYLGSIADPSGIFVGDRYIRLMLGLSLFDFNKCHVISAPDYKINLTFFDFEPSREDPVTRHKQIDRRPIFGVTTGPLPVLT